MTITRSLAIHCSLWRWAISICWVLVAAIRPIAVTLGRQRVPSIVWIWVNSRVARYHKVADDTQSIEATLLTIGVCALRRDTTAGLLDLDAAITLSI
jgi:hypothetical protein